MSQQGELYEIFQAYASGHSGRARLESSPPPLDTTPADTGVEGMDRSELWL